MVLESSWCDKYRPKKLEDMIFGNKLMIKNILKNPFRMQHILLYSKIPGTGKTTLGKIIINELNADNIVLNSSKDRTLDVLRERVTKFSENKSSNSNSPKIILMDEIDGMRLESQNALRGIMESNSHNCKFILTCNDINKVSDAIQSRCIKIPIKQHNKISIFNLLSSISEKENVNIKIDKLHEIVDKHYPSIRNCIQELQIYHLSEGKENLINHSQEIYDMIKGKKFLDIRKKVLEEGLDVEELVSDLWQLFIKDDIKNKKELVLLFAELDYKLKIGATPEIQLMWFICETERYF